MRSVMQLARFGAVGASNTAITFVAYAIALQLGVRYLPAGAGAFALGGLNGFVLNRAWTFKHRGPALAAGWRYAVVLCTGMLADVALLRLAVHGLGLGRLPGQVAAAVPVTLLGFALSRLWVFGAASPDAAAGPHPAARPPLARARRVRRLRGALGRATRRPVAVR
jgi:putative flippase GtrA